MSETIDIRSVWDAAQPGDVLPDPGWPYMVPNDDLTWCCNRAAGHKPGTQHVATVAGIVVAVWTRPPPTSSGPSSTDSGPGPRGVRA